MGLRCVDMGAGRGSGEYAAGARRRGERAGKYGGLLWITFWLWPLLSPVIATARGRVQPVLPAAVGLAAFVALYIVVASLAWSDRPPPKGRLFPLLAVLAVLGLALSAGYAGGPDGWLIPILFVAAAGTASLRSSRYAFAWLIGAVVAVLAIGAARGVAGGELGSTAFSVFTAGVVVYVVRQMNRLIDQLRATQAELAKVAVSEERLRFARDMHDLLGHTLSVVVVKAAVVRRLAERDPAVAAREAGEIEEIGRRALVEIREAVTGYRECRLDTELAGARKALSGAGIEVTVRESGKPLPAAAESVLTWAVREGVTNVIRHSGARRCEIDIRRVDGDATLEIRDDGRGGVAAPAAGANGAGQGSISPDGLGPDGLDPGGVGGHGLRGIAERVRAAGGTFEAGVRPGGGFRLTATIPTLEGNQ